MIGQHVYIVLVIHWNTGEIPICSGDRMDLERSWKSAKSVQSRRQIKPSSWPSQSKVFLLPHLERQVQSVWRHFIRNNDYRGIIHCHPFDGNKMQMFYSGLETDVRIYREELELTSVLKRFIQFAWYE